MDRNFYSAERMDQEWERMIREEERILFDSWKSVSAKPETIVADGIIDISSWASLEDKKHIAFVLRDKNGNVGGKYRGDLEYPNNFRKDLAETGSGARTWNNIARWGQVLHNPDLQYEDVKWFSSGRERGEALKPFAVINLLKEYGSSRTERKILDALPQEKEYCSLLKRQFALYKPDMVIACGMRSNGHKSNMEILAEIFEVEPTEYYSIEANGRKYRYFLLKIDSKKIPVIEFYHPQVTMASVFGKMRGHQLWEMMFSDMNEIAKIADDAWVCRAI